MKTILSNQKLTKRAVAICLFIYLLISAILPSSSFAQQLPPIVVTKEMLELQKLPMHSVLYDLDKATDNKRLTSTASAARNLGLIINSDNQINVEIVSDEDVTSIVLNLISKMGGKIDATWRNRVSAWMPAKKLIELAKALPKGHFLEKANTPYPANEGPELINSDEYRNAGADGSGIRIGIIDGGFRGLGLAAQSGQAPAAWHGENYTDESWLLGEIHGAACVETVYDHAPGAKYFLYKIGNLSHLGKAVDHAVKNKVNIISHSLGWFNTGWDDDSGDACKATKEATKAGILFFTAAGNCANEHWQGNFNPGAGNLNWHDWVSGDETIDIILQPNQTIDIFLSWNTNGGTYNYDLFLYNSEFQLLRSSKGGGNSYENIHWQNGGSTQTYHISVWRSSGGITEFELFTYTDVNWQEHIIASNSTLSPTNCTEPNCISVGAVERYLYHLPSGYDGIVASYSSRGPTNSDAFAPDICAPTSTATIAYHGAFGGTSCATPNAAGATAAFWSAHPKLGFSYAIRHLIFEQAAIYKDWGNSGADNIYGRGGMALIQYHANTVWVDQRIANPLGWFFLPYNTVRHAQNGAESGGRVVFIGQKFHEEIILDKKLRYESIGSPAIISP